MGDPKIEGVYQCKKGINLFSETDECFFLRQAAFRQVWAIEFDGQAEWFGYTRPDRVDDLE